MTSTEGTTQDDPFAMPVYAVGVVPLLSLIKSAESRVKHAAYADDLGGAGTLIQLKSWWDNVLHYGPLIGYHPNASKSWLVVKEESYEQANEIFGNTNINITTSGRKYLGSYIGTANNKSDYADKVVKGWIEELKILCKIARSEPHAAYTCFVSGFRHRITYLTRVIPDFCNALKMLDAFIKEQFLPVLTEGHHCSEIERELISLPVRYGGLGIPVFSEIANQEYDFSKRVTIQLSTNIKQQTTELTLNNSELRKTKNHIANERTKSHEQKLRQLRESMTPDQRKANELSCMKGASSWLTSLPLKAENFVLNKREFYDALRLRYRWHLRFMPAICVCGKQFSVDHAMSCQKGGYIHHRHNELRDLLGKLATEISNDVSIEPALQPLSGEQLPRNSNTSEEARLDISVRGFWQREQSAFFDVRVFNPFAPSYRNQKLENTFAANEREKKRAYSQRVLQVEHGSFTPLVFAHNGGSGREAEKYISVLSTKIAEKRDLPVSSVTNWIRTKLSFALLRSAILCIRGSRNRRTKVEVDTANIELVEAICRID